MAISKELDSKIIEMYNSGRSLNSIAKEIGSYSTSVGRVITRNGGTLRPLKSMKGSYTVQNGEELLNWVKSQDHLVTRQEMANRLGKSRLSPSYFKKHPELGQFVAPRTQKELSVYKNKLYSWLRKHDIPYVPDDRTMLNSKLDALLVGDYTGTAIHILEKPQYVSRRKHEENLAIRGQRAEERGLILIYLYKDDFASEETLTHRLSLLEHTKTK